MKDKDDGTARTRDVEQLDAACSHEGCPICTVVQASIDSYLVGWQYEGFTDIEGRQQLIQARGFCPLHTWLLVRRQSIVHLAVVYREVLAEVLDHMQSAQDNGTTAHGAHAESVDTQVEENQPKMSNRRGFWQRWRRGKKVDPTPDYASCSICGVRDKAEQRLTATFVSELQRSAFQARLRQSNGLCLPHFALAQRLAEHSDPDILPVLTSLEVFCISRALDDVRELLRKQDYRFASEPVGQEVDAWKRGAYLCVGNENIHR